MKSIKNQIIFMYLYFFAVYLPFYVFMLVKYEAYELPMSFIGWSHGGIFYLILFLALTLPFCAYLVLFFNKYLGRNKKSIKYFTITSCFLLALGALIPAWENEPLILLAHTVLSVSSTVILMLTILYVLIHHAINRNYEKKTHKLFVLSLYGMYIAALLISFFILYTAALFQLTAAISFFMILLFMNTKVVTSINVHSSSVR